MSWVSRILAIHSLIHANYVDLKIANVRSNLINSAKASWELGTAAEALTELSWPALSVFERTAFPPTNHRNASYNAADVLDIANKVMATRPKDSPSLVANDGAAADPASIGVSVLMANWTRSDLSDVSYSNAVRKQLQYLLYKVPRSKSGAISHRASETQLWADFVYMVPPFIAYYGALQQGTEGTELLQVAYDQCRLYRQALRDKSGLWKHITLGNWQDNSHWATGNAWAAAGMLRVLASLKHSTEANKFSEQQADLREWIQEIVSAAWSYQVPHHQTAFGTLLNVLDDPKTFGDTASTALIASVTYRLAVLNKDSLHVSNADRAMELIKNSIDRNGWLRNTVNPYTFHSPSPPDGHSPEGQAFVLLMYAGWRQYVDQISRIG
ncbi:hypothetical protein AMATHDRAFT_189281 [Amanita thiersii Skay4041]|uniref:Glycoside hydrolase family 105 protein n=1 Tax=Amanita thiersii Skay4041 TaxID=703135 RepID=A0A2A9NXM6_9AGAR|nr:hypothetical protein AMATHDRAFT_189281 [Amanita thiersii Skay4041]